jgi:hypothetical protein
VTLNELKALVSKFTYKPNSTFRVKSYAPDDFNIIEVSILCADVNNPTKQNFVTNQSAFYENEIFNWTTELVIYKIINAIQSIEDHESREWLRLDGKFVRDPHPELQHGNNYPRET